ncbi:hypothetical protein D3C78_1798960 [compost metagenome]
MVGMPRRSSSLLSILLLKLLAEPFFLAFSTMWVSIETEALGLLASDISTTRFCS